MVRDSKIIICKDVRECLVEDKKAFFHQFCNRSEIIAPSSLIGGNGGGVLQYVTALVEYEDGSVAEVMPNSIRFTDNLVKDFYASGEKHEAI